MVTLFNGVDIKVEVANFCSAMDTLIDQDDELEAYCLNALFWDYDVVTLRGNQH